MVCLACAASCRGRLCGRCRGLLRPGGERLAGVVPVRAAFVHDGPARRLVHRLKYQGLRAAAVPLAEAMAPLLDPLPQALVPVPRARARHWRYGVDPGRELARALEAVSGVALVAALRPGWWHRRRAGASDVRRGLPVFRALGPAPPGALLVDDVITTGSTLRSAAAALGGVGGAVTATAATSSGIPARSGRREPGAAEGAHPTPPWQEPSGGR